MGSTFSRLAARHPFLEGIGGELNAAIDALVPLEVPEGTALFDEARHGPAGTLVPGTEQFTLVPNDSGSLLDDLTARIHQANETSST